MQICIQVSAFLGVYGREKFNNKPKIEKLGILITHKRFITCVEKITRPLILLPIP